MSLIDCDSSRFYALSLTRACSGLTHLGPRKRFLAAVRGTLRRPPAQPSPGSQQQQQRRRADQPRTTQGRSGSRGRSEPSPRRHYAQSTSASRAHAVDGTFDSMDANNDGVIDREEWDEMQHRLAQHISNRTLTAEAAHFPDTLRRLDPQPTSPRRTSPTRRASSPPSPRRQASPTVSLRTARQDHVASGATPRGQHRSLASGGVGSFAGPGEASPAGPQRVPVPTDPRAWTSASRDYHQALKELFEVVPTIAGGERR